MMTTWRRGDKVPVTLQVPSLSLALVSNAFLALVNTIKLEHNMFWTSVALVSMRLELFVPNASTIRSGFRVPLLLLC